MPSHIARSEDEPVRIQDRVVLTVFAHPDDEAIACGGTLARLSDAGARVIALCASKGERGSTSRPELVVDGDLGRVRSNELRASAKMLGIAEVHIFDHPDGNLRWMHVHEFHAEIVNAITQYRPDTVITFAEDGLYWHVDHIGVHERTCTAVQSFGEAAPSLYYVTTPPGLMPAIVEEAISKGWGPSDASFWGIPPTAFGKAARPPTLTVDVRAWASRKLAAIRCHRTQMGASNPFALMADADARKWIGVEHFRRAATIGSPASVLELVGADPLNPQLSPD
jgi:N-acetyl-1-D-myo-inositol-2-amino-2-deoxy-alpha-D-glucopyranoside deacetylase